MHHCINCWGLALIVWALSGLLSLIGALCYAELGTMIPSSGAEYSYFMEAFGPFPAYMFSWVSTFIIKPSQLAIICMSFAAYSVEAFAYECAPDPFIIQVAFITITMTTMAIIMTLAGGARRPGVFLTITIMIIILCMDVYVLAGHDDEDVAGLLPHPLRRCLRDNWHENPNLWCAATGGQIWFMWLRNVFDEIELIKDNYRGVFRTFELRVLTVIDCPKIAGAKGRWQ